MVFRRRIEPHRLGIQLLVFVVVAVGVVFAGHSYYSYRSTKSGLLAALDRSAVQSSDLIARATHDAMLLNRLDDVQDMIGRLATGGDVAAIRIYDKKGHVVLSADTLEIGSRSTFRSETCASCHGPRPTLESALLARESMAKTADGGEVLQHLRVIPNEVGCAGAGCHRSVGEQRVLGVLDVEMSMAAMETLLGAERTRSIASSLLLMILLGVGSALYIHYVIHRPVLRLIAGTRRIAEGDLNAKIEVRGSDELAELAQSFNRMAASLSRAEAQLTDWSQRLEQKVVEKTEQLQVAHAQVLQMDRMASLGKMAATVAHELNNPLTGMLNYTRLTQRTLGEASLDVEQRSEVERYLRCLQDECVRCGRIVTNLLLFARPSGSEMRLVDAAEIVDRSLLLVDHQLQVGAICVEKRILARDSRLVADGAQLEQALLALMVNAVEAMSDQVAEERTLGIELDGDAEELRITVEDSGVGISPESLPRIFEPFYSTKDEQSGVGLGLAVTYGIVRRHGGRIDVESQPGRGSRFRLVLPRDCNRNAPAAVDPGNESVLKGVEPCHRQPRASWSSTTSSRYATR